MTRERIFREEGDWPSAPTGDDGNPLVERDYRHEAEEGDQQLHDSLSELARMFAPCDFVNRGAQ